MANYDDLVVWTDGMTPPLPAICILHLPPVLSFHAPRRSPVATPDPGLPSVANYDVFVVLTDGTTPALEAIFNPLHLPSLPCEVWNERHFGGTRSSGETQQRKLGAQYLR